jgi:hypothetical protein
MFPHILACGITPMIDWAEKFLDFKQKRKDMMCPPFPSINHKAMLQIERQWPRLVTGLRFTFTPGRIANQNEIKAFPATLTPTAIAPTFPYRQPPSAGNNMP